MDAAKVLIADLEKAIEKGSAGKCNQTALRITGLFVAMAGRLNDEQVELFDNVLGRLIRKIDTQAAAKMSRDLAPVHNAPLDIVRHFAKHDDIDLAEPALTQSPRLTDAELIEIVTIRSENASGMVHLVAIAARPRLGTGVTDVLLEHGDYEVFRKLAENPGAHFSDGGFVILLKLAESDAKLAEAAGLRSDLSLTHFQDLLARTTEAVWSRLLVAAPPKNRLRIGRILAIVAEEIPGAAGAPSERDFAQANTRALMMLAKGKMNEAALLEFAKAGRHADMIAVLAILAGAPLHMMRNLMRSEHAEALLIPGKTAGLGWPAARIVLASGAAGGAMAEADFEAARIDYIKLPPETAKRILRFWQGRYTAPRESVAPEVAVPARLAAGV